MCLCVCVRYRNPNHWTNFNEMRNSWRSWPRNGFHVCLKKNWPRDGLLTLINLSLPNCALYGKFHKTNIVGHTQQWVCVQNNFLSDHSLVFILQPLIEVAFALPGTSASKLIKIPLSNSIAIRKLIPTWWYWNLDKNNVVCVHVYHSKVFNLPISHLLDCFAHILLFAHCAGCGIKNSTC